MPKRTVVPPPSVKPADDSRLQDAVYRIVQASSRSSSLDELLPRVHAIINDVMPASNFYIALYHDEDDTVTFPYYVDEIDAPPVPGHQPLGRGLTAYVLRTGKPQLVDMVRQEKLEKQGKVELVGAPSQIWLGVPLMLDGSIIGAMVVQHYSDPTAFGEREQHMLEVVCSQVAGVIGRRQREDAIAESEERYRRLFEDSPVSIWDEDFTDVRERLDQLRAEGVTDLSAYLKAHPEVVRECADLVRIRDVNLATLRMFKVTSKDAFKQHLSSFIPAESLTVFCDELLAFVDGRTWFEAETLNLTANGEPMNIVMRVSLASGVDSRWERVLVSIVDVTAQKRTEQALRESEQGYRALFENIPDGVYRTTVDGEILAANPALIRMLGFDSEEELLQQRVQQFYSIKDARDLFVDELIAGREARNMEIVLRGRDGRELICLDNGRAVRDDKGNVLFFEGVLTDITELKKTASALQEKVITLQMLADIDRQVLAADDVETILRLVALNAAALLHTPKAIVVSCVGGGTMRVNALYGMADERATRREFGDEKMQSWLEDLISGRAKPELEHLSRSFRQSEGINAAAVAPFVIDQDNRGLLMIFDSKPREWTDDDIDILILLAGQAAIAVEKARLFGELKRRADELRRQNEELDRLYRASESLISGISFDLDALARTIVEIVLGEFRQVNCSLFLLDDDGKLLRRLAVAGPSAGHFSFTQLDAEGTGLVARAVRTGKVVNVGDVLSAPDYLAGWPEARSELTVPLVVRDHVIGALDLQSSRPDAFSEQDARLLGLFASRAALLMEHARLNAQTELRMQRLSALRAIDLAIASSLDLRITLNVLLEQITSQLQVDAVSILLHNPLLQVLEFAASRGFTNRAIERFNFKIGEDYPGLALKQRHLISIEELEAAVPPMQYPERLAGDKFVTYFALPLITKGTVKGVLELFYRRKFVPDAEWHDFLDTLARQAAIAIDDAALFEDLQRSNTELAVAYDAAIEGWARVLELRGKEPEGHTRRVTDLTLDLARNLGVTEDELVHIYRGVLLHDVGELIVPDSVLAKPGPLTELEWAEVRRHPDHARDLLFPIVHLHPALEIPHCHHERWDGSGYPRGLKGEQIPLSARIFAVVDVWDSMLSERPHRPPNSRTETLTYIKEQSGKHFDPRVADAFLELIENRAGAGRS